MVQLISVGHSGVSINASLKLYNSQSLLYISLQRPKLSTYLQVISYKRHCLLTHQEFVKGIGHLKDKLTINAIWNNYDNNSS